MIKKVNLKNFMSYGNAEFDFEETATKCKKFIAIYGENGSGKSNFVLSIYFLCRSINSINNMLSEEDLSNLINISKEKNVSKDLIENILLFNNFSKYLKYCRTIDCKEPTVLKFDFTINDIDGYYEVSFIDKIISEKLYYMGDKKRTTLFNISEKNENIDIKFSSSLIRNNDYANELKSQIYKFWGKHTFLSIISEELKQKNHKFLFDNLNINLFRVLYDFNEISVFSRKSNDFSSGKISSKYNIMLNNLNSGVIDLLEEEKLHTTENIINDFFTQLYADIKKVKYDVEFVENGISYTLYSYKMISGEIRKIKFSDESAGTQKILNVLQSLISVLFGEIVVYDEIDDGIHDKLLSCVLESIIPEMKGQLIITTHNTYLMETLNPSSIYVIDTDYMGNKVVNCATDYGIRPNDTHNIRKMYLSGSLGGVPYSEEIDLSDIIGTVSDKIGENIDEKEKN